MLKYLLIGLIIASNVAGDVLTAGGMKTGEAVEDLSLRGYARLAASVLRNVQVMAGVAVLAVGFFAFLAVLSIANVSFVVPATAAGYFLKMLLARYVLQEEISLQRWVGAVMVALGVVLLSS